MSREILFRGKRTYNKKWIEGSLVVDYAGNTYIVWEYETVKGAMISSKTINVYPETVGEYTGLTDKNGKKIFEGDIVKGDREYFTYAHLYGRVVYDGGQFSIAFDDALEDIECLGAWANAVEVIGNIHDNPELLEV